MKRWYWNAAIFAALVGSHAAFAEEPKKTPDKPAETKAEKSDEKPSEDKRTAMEKYKDAKKASEEHTKVLSKMSTELRKKNEKPLENEEYQAALKKYRESQAVSLKLAAEAAKSDPKSKDGAEALFAAFRNARPSSPLGKELFDLALEHHEDHPQFQSLLFSFADDEYSEASEKNINRVLEKTKSDTTKALCTYVLGSLKLNAQDKAVQKKGEELLDEVVKKYADIKPSRRPLGTMAEGQLFEYRNLSIGKQVPEIEGEDTDGKKFKLSDYKGKVILLDFWAHW
jgi:hypothetical protein